MRSLLIPAVAAGAVLLPAVAAAAGPAATPADLGSVSCRGGSLDLGYNPGITFAKQTVRLTADGDLGLCASAAHPKITGGRVHVEATTTAQCPGPFGPGYARITVSWNDGTTSIVDQSAFRSDAASFTLDSGRVTVGPFAGGTAQAHGRTTTDLIEIGAGCATGGAARYTAALDQFAVGDL